MHKRCPYLRGPYVLAALLPACQPALAGDWSGQAAFSTDQVVRGLAYIDKPLLEASGSWNSERGWAAGALAARALDAPQSTLAVHAGYGWPLAAGIDAYASLGHADYRREGDWRLRYHDVRFSVNLHDRLFLSLQRTFDVQRRFGAGSVAAAGTLAKEVVWRQPLPHALTLVAGIGHAAQRSDDGFSYWYGNVGVAAALGGATVEVNWIGTGSGAVRRFGSQAGERWVGGVRWNF